MHTTHCLVDYLPAIWTVRDWFGCTQRLLFLVDGEPFMFVIQCKNTRYITFKIVGVDIS